MLANQSEAGAQTGVTAEVDGKDILIVVSKLKAFIRQTSGMNTSNDVAAALSSLVRGLCSQAIERAKADGRKTVMERDFRS